MMKEKLSFVFFLCVVLGIGTPAFSQQGRIYISPNNDGVQDQLEVPLSITDKRYIKEWQFIVENESNDVVRRIGNKISHPEKLTFKNFFNRLFAEKKGVDVPNSVIWDGSLDSGEIAPDGLYFYYLTATDDNGNVSTTKHYEVVVDNTPPVVNLAQPVSDDDKIFGEGRKQEFNVEQFGSQEELWTGSFLDTAGTAVRSFTWKSDSPASFSWDGRDDQGVPVADGVYSYDITATDLAGNRAPLTQIANIIYSAEKPSTNILINGSRYFSPNGDTVQDTMLFDVTIPMGSGAAAASSGTGAIAGAVAAGNRLVHWKIDIANTYGTVVRTFSGEDNPPVVLFFDGTDDNGNILPNGSYQAIITAGYSNGYETPVLRSPIFVLDTEAPSAVVRSDSAIFSPDGDGRLDTLKIYQEASLEKEWKGEIVDSNGRVVRTYIFGGLPSESFLWEGLDSQGRLCDDGTYTYRLSSTDQAGNKGQALSQPFELNTGTTEVILTVQPSVFSPNGDGVQDAVVLTPVIKSKSGIASYDLHIKDAAGTTVKTFSGTGSLPARISWNGLSDSGERCGDGTYSAILETVSKNGSMAKTLSQPFTMDTVAPEVSVSTEYLLFSPDGDGNKDVVNFTVDSSFEEKWIGRIESASGALVQELVWEGKAQSFQWDGTNDSGNLVEDGRYKLTISSQDAAGNKAVATISGLQVDTRQGKVYLTAEQNTISPNGDGFKDQQKFTIRLTLTEGIESWHFDIKNASGAVVRSWNQDDYKDVPSTIVWDGLSAASIPVEGSLTGNITINYAKGTVLTATTAPFVSSVTPPQLTVRTAPEYFSPDNDGVDDDLYISLGAVSAVSFKSWSFQVYDPENGKVFWSRTGSGTVTERLVWDGRGNNGELVQSATDYPFVFSVSDELGMSSEVAGLISVDVLVLRVGDVLKMQVPSIIFRSDKADFVGKDEDPMKGLDQSVIDNNIRVLKRIAEILNKFKEYTVRIEGHANNVTGTEAEETSTANGNIPLVPLSEARAETVRKMLIEFGVSAHRLSTVGMGGRSPVVPHGDRDNWWKNRRVEFILNK
ncbi:MAG: OmpA family protein [Spirochaetia bacterium]|nr:OmpA family protein [Spirochaetia bacterium]